MTKKKQVTAQAAIDQAQAALDTAEQALQAEAVKQAAAAADLAAGQPNADLTAAGAIADPPAEKEQEPQPTSDPDPADSAAPVSEGPALEGEAFTLGEALSAIGHDARYPSSHPMHRTIIGVVFHGDQPFFGIYQETRPEKFKRDVAAAEAIKEANAAANRFD